MPLFSARTRVAFLVFPFALLLLAGCDSDDEDDDGGFFGIGFEQTIGANAAVNGTLSSDDSRASDFDEAITGGPVDDEDNTFVDVYRFEVGAGERTINLTSPDFDTVLVLYQLDGTLVEVNDDADTTTLNSRIVRTLDADTYALVVTSFSGGETGSYALSVD
jgi:hypothetical protein